MDHQPKPREPDENSTSRNLEGGTLTNLMSDRSSYVPYIHSETIDTMITKPWLVTHLDTTKTTTNVLIRRFGPTFSLEPVATCIPYGILAMIAHNFYDFDLEFTIRLFKHERARGKFAIFWYPGVDVPGDTDKETADNAGLTINNFADMHSTAQRWEFDIETDDTFTFLCKGLKMTAWRSSRICMGKVERASTVAPRIYEPNAIHVQSSVFGTLAIVAIHKYDNGNVAPDNVTMHLLAKITNPSFLEYSGFNSVDDITEDVMKNIFNA